MAFKYEVQAFLIDTCNVDSIELDLELQDGKLVDFYLPKAQFGIAVYSVSHHSAPMVEKRIFLSHFKDFPIIHLWEDQWIHKREIVQARLLSQLGKNKKIHGRQTEIKPIATTETLKFLSENHLHVPLKAKYKYGLFHHIELVAVATFSKRRVMEREGRLFNSYEMVRFCNKNGYTVVGGLSKLISFFIEHVNPDDIMTYTDKDWPGGRAYNLLGFEKVDELPSFELWIDKYSRERQYPHRIIAERFPQWENMNISSITDDQLFENGFYRVLAGGSIKLLKRLK